MVTYVHVCVKGVGEGAGGAAHLPHHSNPFQRTLLCSNPVYLLYLQYNASVSISNFETQVSIRGAARTSARVPSQVRRRDEHHRRVDSC